MVDDIEICFKVGVCDLLEEDTEFILDLLGFVEEVELVLVVDWEETIDQLLELLGSS